VAVLSISYWAAIVETIILTEKVADNIAVLGGADYLMAFAQLLRMNAANKLG